MLKSFRSQTALIAIFLALVPTVVVGWIGYHTAARVIREQATRIVGVVASGKKTMLAFRLTRQIEAAEGILNVISQKCTSDAKGYPACARRLLANFMSVNKVLDVEAEIPGFPPLALGPSADMLANHSLFKSGQLAEFSPRTIPQPYYIIDAYGERPGARIIVRYTTDDIEEMFREHPGLGATGETFLADKKGFFLTQPRFSSHSGVSHPIDASPMVACLSGVNDEVLALDYRPAAVIHGFRYVPEIGGGCIMAHIQQVEAFAPLATLRLRIIQLGILFATIGIAASVLIGRLFSQKVSCPMKNLVERVQRARLGDLESPVLIEGPTELRTLAQGFADLTESLRTSNQRRNDLFSIVSHDLRSPLTAIFLNIGIIEQILRKQPDQTRRDLQAAISRLEECSKNMERLIESTLNLGVTQTGNFVIKPGRHEIKELLVALTDMFQPIADEKHIKIKTDLPEDAPHAAEFDWGRIHEVLSNLLANAIKFTPRGGSVTMQVTFLPNEIRFGVIDTGPGIPVDKAPLIFERFYQIKKPGSMGVGLGLYIAKQIIEAHGGKIWVESEPNQGAKFFFTIPVTRALGSWHATG